MTLFGALSSGVSGLTAQSSAIGAISDNITNVSTIGYKNTQVEFQTLVTKQTSSTFYSAGGVQSRPRQDTGVQGLLAASASQTDIAISGAGFFVVNEVAQPTLNNEFLFTRAGAFFQDSEGFLRNTAGFYLQAWPTDAAGNIVPANQDLTVPNKNVISTDFLSTVNLSRVGGTASSTKTIGIGANLPSNDDAGTTHKTDVQFFDTLGNPNNVSFVYSKGVRDNEWDLEITPPQGVAVTTLYADTAGSVVYESRGQLEFVETPSSGSQVVIDSITYQFSTFASVTASATNTFVIDTTNDSITAASGTFTGLKIGDTITITNAEDAGNNLTTTLTAVASDGSSINVAANLTTNAADTTMTVTIQDTAAIKIIDVSTATTLAQYVSALVAKVKGSDSDFANVGTTTNNRIQIPATSSTTVYFTDDGTGAITVDPSGLLTSAGVNAVRQETSYTVQKTASAHRDYFQFTFGTAVDFTDGETITINDIVYEVDTGDNTVSGTNKAVTVGSAAAGGAGVLTAAQLHTFLTNLEAAIEANDPEFASTTVRIRRQDDTAEPTPSTNTDTLVLDTLSKGSYNVLFSTNFTNTAAEPDGTASYSNGTNFAVNKDQAIQFSSDGLPSEFNVAKMELIGFSNGAADMDDSADTPRITLDFGTITEANGLTQFGGSFTPVFITQDGSQFGTFAGVTISTKGLITALFDNGETRPVYQIPIATFVNVNSLGSRTGNIWNSTEASGSPTLRDADNGPAGQVVQASLEQSTVDIGTEFTKMIVVQRAFSAAAKIITTADEMLDELIRTKR
jgi:flagellar hook protein FlgE